ncbi:MAG TPA: PEGA domain-containing protein, partial [Kofleriaceae bacterium]|nr:PEGA domain-containing protein [Kofleriaceae bacterium]
MAGLALFGLCSVAAAQVTNPKLKSTRSKYKVRIDSTAPHATVYLDDKAFGAVGYTPWEGKLISSSWKIIVEAEGFDPVEKTVTVARKRTTQEFVLVQNKKIEPGTIEVRGDADPNAFGAQVWVDGQLQGNVPITLKLSDGRHLIEVKKDDFVPFSTWQEIQAGQKIPVQVMLRPIEKPKKGNIIVEADVPDAEVLIDGNPHNDTTPTTINGVLVGPHIVEVRKTPAIPWKQTVNVEENKTVKVRAELKATIGGPKGTIKIVCNVEKARVFLDGQEMGPAPAELKDVSPGEHVLEVKAVGYQPEQRRVTINAGQAHVETFNLNPEAKAQVGNLKVVSPVPDAQVYIDGEGVGSTPQNKEVAPGDHFVVVQKQGYKKFEKKVRLEAGQTISITAELKAVGAIKILTRPSPADVEIDGKPAGKTPFDAGEIDVGKHVIVLRYEGYYDLSKTIEVKGGDQQVMNESLEMIDTGPTPEQLEREQKSLTSYGAKVLPKLRTTLDLGAGYPYVIDGRMTVGAGNLAGRPFDASFFFRSFFSRTELGIGGRINLAYNDPFAAGLFAQIGLSSNFFDDSGRNGVQLDTGLAASLSGLGSVTITGRAYLQMWSDRHCPSRDSTGAFPMGKNPIDTCQQLADGTLAADKLDHVQQMLGMDPNAPFARETGARLMVSVIAEIAIYQHWNLWALFEGPPFQGERAAYTDLFSPFLIKEDIGTYFR